MEMSDCCGLCPCGRRAAYKSLGVVFS
jgi:hypothetical protein